MLIIGLGNLLLADEGVGVHAVRLLKERRYRQDVVILDIGTAVLDALPALETAQRVIIIDAMKADGLAGSVYRIPYDDCLRPSAIASLHGFDLSRVLARAGRTDCPEITVIGVEPARIDWSLELSPEVVASLPVVLEAVEEEIDRYCSNISWERAHRSGDRSRVSRRSASP
jgi:hydrogenase maturation protease